MSYYLTMSYSKFGIEQFSEKQLTPFKIVLLYAIVVGVWIPFSDILLAYFIHNPIAYAYLKTFKDYSYVVTTAWMLYALINQYMKAIWQSQITLQLRSIELAEANEQLMREITERKQIETILRKTEEEKAVILDSMSEGVVYLDAKKDILWANRAAVESMGFSDNPLAVQPQLSAPVERAIQTGKPEKDEVALDDGRAWVVKVYPVTGADSVLTGVVVVVLEITERKRAEEERVRLVTAIEQSAEAIIISDHEGTIRYVNPAFSRITGFSSDEAVGTRYLFLKSDSYDERFFRTIWRSLKKNKVWAGRLVNKKKNGEGYEAETTISQVQNINGEVVNYVAVMRDVTQEAALEARLRQARKMEAIGALAGGIAHDFNNILTPILINSEIALLDTPKDDPISDTLRQILEAGRRGKDLVKQILTFSRHSKDEQKPLAPAPIVKEAIQLLRTTLPPTIRLVEHIDADGVMILADPVKIHQAVMNLCINAIHAMKDTGGELEVSLNQIALNAAEARLYPEIQPGYYLRLTVSDTGCGMESKVADRIFEPFFTTKKPGEGTGLGLAMVHGMVKGCRGAIAVRTSPCQGSTFTALFPCSESENVLDNELPLALPTGDEQILLIDDEPSMVRSVSQILRRLGYQVDVYTTSLEALTAFKNNPQYYDLVITDYTMPQMTGLELAKALTDVRADIPIILCTGFIDLLTPQQIKSAGVASVLMKPIESKELALTTRKTIDQGGAKE
jgi:PAS domain S-box-containing protein